MPARVSMGLTAVVAITDLSALLVSYSQGTRTRIPRETRSPTRTTRLWRHRERDRRWSDAPEVEAGGDTSTSLYGCRKLLQLLASRRHCCRVYIFLTSPTARQQDGPLAISSSSTCKASDPTLDVGGDPSKGQPRDSTVLLEKTDADRDEPQPTSQGSPVSGCAGDAGDAEGLQEMDGGMLDSAGDSTTVWSSLELDMNFGPSAKGQNCTFNQSAFKLLRLRWKTQANVSDCLDSLSLVLCKRLQCGFYLPYIMVSKNCFIRYSATQWLFNSIFIWSVELWTDGSLGSRQHCSAQEVPRTSEALRLHRNTLTMELLWLQQAIDSRKKVQLTQSRKIPLHVSPAVALSVYFKTKIFTLHFWTLKHIAPSLVNH